MVESINKVSLVVDRNYGERLQSLVGSGPIWLIDTEVNRKAATEYWQLNPKPKREAAVTTFKYLVDDSVSATCLNILGVIDLHHGKYSGGYSELEVIGAPIGEELRSAITELGFIRFDSTADGFRASR
jgi:hypothetical protein